ALALAAASVNAQDTKKDSTSKDMTKPMTMQECKDHMAMQKTDAMKKDDMMMKKDAMCADMMKKDGGMMKKDDTTAPKTDTTAPKTDTTAPKKKRCVRHASGARPPGRFSFGRRAQAVNSRPDPRSSSRSRASFCGEIGAAAISSACSSRSGSSQYGLLSYLRACVVAH